MFRVKGNLDIPGGSTILGAPFESKSRIIIRKVEGGELKVFDLSFKKFQP